MSGAPVPYRWAEMRRELREDVETYLDFAAQYSPDRRTFVRRLSAYLTPSMLTCVGYRLSHYAYRRGHHRLAFACAWANLIATRASIAPASRIGGGMYVPHPSTGIVFQGTAGRNLRLFAGSGAAARYLPLHARALAGAPRLGDNVSIGAKAFVAGDVEIGAGTRIGFNAFVDRDLPPGSVVVSAHVRSRRVDAALSR